MSSNSREIIANLESVKNTVLDKMLEQAINKACLVIERDAKVRCPVKTGTLRNSITHTAEGNTGYVGSNIPYAPFIEIGTGLYSSQGDGRKDVPWMYKDAEGQWHITSGSHPHPFLKPARDENLSAIMKCFEGII